MIKIELTLVDKCVPVKTASKCAKIHSRWFRQFKVMDNQMQWLHLFGMNNILLTTYHHFTAIILA